MRYRKPTKVAALNEANAARKWLGLPEVKRLYPGLPSQAYACAITATVIDDDLDTDTYEVVTGGSLVVYRRSDSFPMYATRLTAGASEFTVEFDAHKHKDLIIKEISDVGTRLTKNARPDRLREYFEAREELEAEKVNS